jgi:ubiquinone/menaquinone biosynthesis C-methylase UbiE/glycosyltransferase involved in cell wall biosynthesis
VSRAYEHEGTKLQREYYARTAPGYDEVHDDQEFRPVLELVLDRLQRWGAGSVLDVGTGTGRLVREVLAHDPQLPVHGIDPVPELLALARDRFGVPDEILSVADGEELPFANGSWDAVCALGVLHHVPDPGAVVDEMLRVATRMVVIGDDNRFGRGRLALRFVKLALHRAAVLDAATRALHGGRSYRVSDADGISYAFSVYEILDRVETWADEVVLVPVRGPGRGLLAHWHKIGAPGIVLAARRAAAPAGVPDSPLRLSVVVPSYRRSESLARCLDGLARQEQAADEVIVVARADDAATLSVVQAAGRLRVRAVEVRASGLLAALHAGARAATGDVVAFTDDDAVPRPDWVRRLHDHFADSAVGAVGGRDVIPGDAGDETRDVGRITSWGRLVGNQHLAIGGPRTVDVLKGVNIAFRRGALALPCELRGRGAQVHCEISMCAWARAGGWRVVFDPAVVVDHLPAPRPSGDHRVPDRQDVRAAAFNLVLAIATFYPALAWRRAVYGLLVGDRMTPGVLRAAVATVRGERQVRRIAPAAVRGQTEALAALARGRRQRMVAVGPRPPLPADSAVTSTMREPG